MSIMSPQSHQLTAPTDAWQDETGARMASWLAANRPSGGWRGDHFAGLLDQWSGDVSAATWCAMYNAASPAVRRTRPFESWLQRAWATRIVRDVPSDGDWCCAGLLTLDRADLATPDVAHRISASRCLDVRYSLRRVYTAWSSPWLAGIVRHARPDMAEMDEFWLALLNMTGYDRRWAVEHIPQHAASRLWSYLHTQKEHPQDAAWPTASWPRTLMYNEMIDSGWPNGWFVPLAQQDPEIAERMLRRLGSDAVTAKATIALARQDATLMPWPEMSHALLSELPLLAWKHHASGIGREAIRHLGKDAGAACWATIRSALIGLPPYSGHRWVSHVDEIIGTWLPACHPERAEDITATLSALHRQVPVRVAAGGTALVAWLDDIAAGRDASGPAAETTPWRVDCVRMMEDAIAAGPSAIGAEMRRHTGGRAAFWWPTREAHGSVWNCLARVTDPERLNAALAVGWRAADRQTLATEIVRNAISIGNGVVLDVMRKNLPDISFNLVRLCDSLTSGTSEKTINAIVEHVPFHAPWAHDLSVMADVLPAKRCTHRAAEMVNAVIEQHNHDALPFFLDAFRDVPDSMESGVNLYTNWKESEMACRALDDWNSRFGRSPQWCRFLAARLAGEYAETGKPPRHPPTMNDVILAMRLTTSGGLGYQDRFAQATSAPVTGYKWSKAFRTLAPILRRTDPVTTLAAMVECLASMGAEISAVNVPFGMMACVLARLADHHPLARAALSNAAAVGTLQSAQRPMQFDTGCWVGKLSDFEEVVIPILTSQDPAKWSHSLLETPLLPRLHAWCSAGARRTSMARPGR